MIRLLLVLALSLVLLVVSHTVASLDTRAPDLIVFTRGQGNGQEIYVTSSGGHNEQRLTNNDVWDGEPSWSPDGQRLAFVRSVPTRGRISRDPDNFGVYTAVDEVWVTSSSGTQPKRLLVGEGSEHALLGLIGPLAWVRSLYWSPDGQRLIFETQGVVTSDQLVSINVRKPRGQTFSAFGNEVSVTQSGEVVSWVHGYSPDLVSGSFNRCVVRDMLLNELETIPALENQYPFVVSPDGSMILFNDRKPTSSNPVMLFDRRSKTMRPLKTTNAVSYHSQNLAASWSPDGTKIAYLSQHDAVLALTLYDLNTDTETLISDNAVYKDVPAWSPDGRRLAYVSNREGNSDIFIYVLGGQEYLLTHDLAPDLSPRWRPN